MGELFMPEKLVPIPAHEKKLVITLILEQTMAGRCMITYRTVKCGVKFGKKQRPIPLYKRH
jgi:hypothetical protein